MLIMSLVNGANGAFYKCKQAKKKILKFVKLNMEKFSVFYLFNCECRQLSIINIRSCCIR